MNIWRLIDFSKGDAYFNMALDEAISSQVQKGKSLITLRLYGWEKPSVSIGFFQNINQIDLLYCKDNDIRIVRRPTGGRGIFHKDELTYSFSAPYKDFFSNGLFKTYYLLGCVFQSAFKAIGIDVNINLSRRTNIKTPLCFKSSSYGELIYNGKKIVGAAQKRWEAGFLQQGSIPFSLDYQAIKKIFRILDDPFFDLAGIRDLVKDFDHDKLIFNIQKAFEETFNITFVHSQPSTEEIDLAQELVLKKYKSPHY